MTDVSNLTASLAAVGNDVNAAVAELRELVAEALVVDPADDVMIQQVQDKAQYIIDKVTAATEGLGADAPVDDDVDGRNLRPDMQVADPSPHTSSAGVAGDPGPDPLKSEGAKSEKQLADKDAGKDAGKSK